MATLQVRVQYVDDTDPFSTAGVFPEPARPPSFTFLTNVPLINQVAGVKRLLNAPLKVEDCALQLCKHVVSQIDYGVYLDLELALDEQLDEIEGFTDNKKNSIILRTRISVRVQLCIDKMLSSEGRELRRALFSLKKLFQDDKDLVHEFVTNGGLDCLVKVGSEADQTFQNYILRALGQILLYVDGMNGIVKHNATIQWIYSLSASQSNMIKKTALKLLLVFVEYSEFNTMLLLQAISLVDTSRGGKLCNNLMETLNEKERNDPELLIYTMTLINKVLNGIPEQDLYYDVTDALEEQGIAEFISQNINNKQTEDDLLEQLRLYEVVLQHEDEGIHSRSNRESAAANSSLSIEAARDTVRELNTPSRDDRLASDQHSDSLLNGAGNVCASSTQHNINLVLRQLSEISQNLEIGGQGLNIQSSAEASDAQQHSHDNNHVVNSQSFINPAVMPRSNSRGERVSVSSTADLSWLENEEASGSLISDEHSSTVSAPLDEFSRQILSAREELKRPSRVSQPIVSNLSETTVSKQVRSEADKFWEQVELSVKIKKHALKIGDLDFSDLGSLDGACSVEQSQLTVPQVSEPLSSVPPPPPPPPPPAPPLLTHQGSTVPIAPALPVAASAVNSNRSRKTVKLHWKEAKFDSHTISGRPADTIWDQMSREIGCVQIDPKKLEHLFETKSVDLKTRKLEGSKKELTFLDHKRSNAINIGLTALPKPDIIKTAILKMDNTVMNREGIEKIISTMMPSEEEKNKLQELHLANPDVPLGAAEHFLSVLCSIPELSERLQLWAFKMDYDTVESEIAEPLSDLKQGIEELRRNRTLKSVLSALLAVGNFLNGVEARGFIVDYLAHVAEVKDTVHKHSLLFHICNMVVEQFPDSTDLYSEIGSITRSAKVDWSILALNLAKLESDCKISWEHVRVIAKHDYNIVKLKMSEFITHCAERIVILKNVHRAVLKRFKEFLLYFGYPSRVAEEVNVDVFCKIISEFALEYRTTRDRVLIQNEKRANQRERKKTRGKMIVETEGFKVTSNVKSLPTVMETEDPLMQCLMQTTSRTRPRRALDKDRQRNKVQVDEPLIEVVSEPVVVPAESAGDEGVAVPFYFEAVAPKSDKSDDEILEAVIKTATTPSGRNPRDNRRRSRNVLRKSLRRTLQSGLTSEEMNAVNKI